MILQKRPTRFSKNNPKIFLLGHKEKFGIITAVNGTCPENITIMPNQIILT
jgi:hypothetical protein